MVKRLGHWNGDMPRYLVWNEKARRTRGSVKYRRRSPSTVENGRRDDRAESIAGVTRSLGLEKACSSTGRKASSFRRMKVKKRRVLFCLWEDRSRWMCD